jgi:hypothetical protein
MVHCAESEGDPSRERSAAPARLLPRLELIFCAYRLPNHRAAETVEEACRDWPASGRET